MAPPSTRGSPAALSSLMAARLSSTGVSPTAISSDPLDLSFQSTEIGHPGIAPQSLTPAPSHYAFRGPASCLGYVAVGKGLLDSGLFRLGCTSLLSLSALECFWLRQLTQYEDWTLASGAPSAKGSSILTNTSVFPSSLVLLSFAWFYIFFSNGQVFCLFSAVSQMDLCVWRCIPIGTHGEMYLRPIAFPPFWSSSVWQF